MAEYIYRIRENQHIAIGDDFSSITANVVETYALQKIPCDYGTEYNKVLRYFQAKAKQDKVDNPAPPRRPRVIKIVTPGSGDTLNFKDLREGGKAIVKNITGQIASREEMNYRAKICAACPVKIRAGDCAKCSLSDNIARMASSARRFFNSDYTIPMELADKGCGICKCSYYFLLAARTEDLHEDTAEQETIRRDIAPYCWYFNPFQK